MIDCRGFAEAGKCGASASVPDSQRRSVGCQPSDAANRTYSGLGRQSKEINDLRRSYVRHVCSER